MRTIAFLLIGTVMIYGCGDQGDSATEESTEPISTEVVSNPATASNAEGIDGNVALPEFTFEKEVHDFGKIVQGEKVSYSFKFRNTGKGDLIITDAKGSCGCTVPAFPGQPIAPGDEGVIDVVFDSEGKEGQQNKKVTITANTVPSTKVLAINGTIEVPVAK